MRVAAMVISAVCFVLSALLLAFSIVNLVSAHQRR